MSPFEECRRRPSLSTIEISDMGLPSRDRDMAVVFRRRRSRASPVDRTW